MRKLLLSIAYLLLLCFSALAKNKIPVKDGVLDLRTWSWEKDGIVSLTGDWEFYWKEFYPPGFFTDTSVAHSKRFASVPSLWNKYIPAGENSTGGFGYATYRVVVLCPAGTELLALKFYTVESAFRLFVNNHEVLNVGHAGTTAEETIADLRPVIVHVQPVNNKLDIVMQVSNFNNHTGGIWYFNKLGTANQIESDFTKNLSVALLAGGGFLLAGLYYLIYFFHFRSRWVFLSFSMLCFAFGTRSLVIEEMPVIYFSNLSWEVIRRAEYISLYLTVPMASLFSYHLFPREFSRKILYVILGVSSVFVALSLFAPYYFYTYPLKYYEGLILVAVFYGLYVYIKAAIKKRAGSFLFLGGFCVFLITVVNDVLYESLIIDTMWMFYIGLAAFCIILSILLARQSVQIFYDLQASNKQLSVANKELDIINNQVNEKNEELKKINYELDSFVNRTSNDLKEPLASVFRIIDAAEEEKDIERLKTYFHIQKKTLSRINNLIKDIITISKNKRLQLDLREIDFSEIVRSAFEDHAMELNEDRIKKNVQIKQYEKFISDARRMGVIINNLISNAIKYVDTSKSNHEITVEVLVYNDMATIEVSDNGIGIEAEKLDKIFTLFYTTTNSITGSGLGLYITKETVEKLKGYITINSKKGEGTKIKVVIPGIGYGM